MKISIKLIIGFSIIGLLVGSIFVTTFLSLRQLAVLQQESTNRSDDAILAIKLEYTPLRLYQLVADAIINLDLAAAQRDWSALLAEETALMETLELQLDTEAEHRDLRETRRLLIEIDTLFTEQLIPLLNNGNGIDERTRSLDEAFDQLVDRIAEPVKRIEASLAEEKKAADGKFTEISGAILLVCSLLTAGVLLVSILTGIILTRGITGPLTVVVESLNAMAQGGLDIEVDASVLRRSDEMVPNIQRTADLVQEISIAGREQDAGTQQISKAITQLDTVIQSNASLSQEFSASSEEMAGQSEMVAATAERLAKEAARMKQAVAFFKLGEQAQATPPVRNQARPITRMQRDPLPTGQDRKGFSRASPANQAQKPEPRTGLTLRRPAATPETDDKDFMEF